MRIHIRTVLLAALLGTFTIGTVACSNKADKAAKEAESARKVAEDKAAEASKAAKEADEKAAIAKREADDNAAKASAEARATLQKEVDASDRKITYLKEKVTQAKGAKKKNADAAATEVDARRAAVKAAMENLGAAPAGTAWDTAKTQVEADTAALNKAIDALETTLK